MNSGALGKLFGLDGQVAVVTGAGAGIGRATALLLADAGADVAVFELDRARSAAVAGEIRARGRRALALVIDVSDEGSVTRGFAQLDAELGRLDVLVNNAGIYPTSSVAEMPVAEWDRVMAVNLRGPMLCMREAVKRMRAGGRGGAIVNLSSIESMHPSFVGMAHYGASKGGLNQLTRSAALEFGPDRIAVNALCPGGVLTEGTQAAFSDGLRAQLEARTPLGRVAAPGDIAAGALFLVSPAGRYVTGQTLVVDGGYLLS